MVVVPIMHTHPIAVSDPSIVLDSVNSVDADKVEVREVISDVNLWDEEW